jgi:hypothetical protein
VKEDMERFTSVKYWRSITFPKNCMQDMKTTTMSNMQSCSAEEMACRICHLGIIKLFALHATKARGYMRLWNDATLRQMLYKSMEAVTISILFLYIYI